MTVNEGASRLRVSTKYACAPITEAIIELRVEPHADVVPTSCRSVFDKIANAGEFLPSQELFEVEASITAGKLVGAQATQTVVGFTRRSNALGQIVSASPDRFAFSQLPPYDTWFSFKQACQSFWDVYVNELQPLKVVRTATRFVNRIEIPVPVRDLSQYLRTRPTISPDMSDEIAGSFLQLRLPQPDMDCTVLLNEAILPVNEGLLPVILDIDIFDEYERGIGDEIWTRLEELRWRKNQIFEACITDQIRTLIS